MGRKKKQKYMSVRDVAELFNVSDRTIRRWMSCGKLPKPLRMSDRFIRWKAEEILALGIEKYERAGGKK